MSADVRQPKNSDEAVTLKTGVAIAASVTDSTEVQLPEAAAYVCVLNVTAAATAAGDKLDVTIQTRIGAVWMDAVHFPQVLGDGGAKCHVEKLADQAAMAGFENAAALAAGDVRDIMGDAYRIKTVVVDAGAASFSFTVVAKPMGQ